MRYIKGPNDLDTSFYYRWHSEKIGNNKVGNSMPFHIHQSAEFIIVVSGEIKVTAGNEPERTVGPMQAAFINPFRPHKYLSLPNTERLRSERIDFNSSLILATASMFTPKSMPSFWQKRYTSSKAGAPVPPPKYQQLVSTTSTPAAIAA